MNKKAIMKREIRGIFKQEEREEIAKDTSDISELSHTIMRICRGAILFVIVITPILDIFSFDYGSLSGFFMSLLYTLVMFFGLTPLIYYLLAMLFLREK